VSCNQFAGNRQRWDDVATGTATRNENTQFRQAVAFHEMTQGRIAGMAGFDDELPVSINFIKKIPAASGFENAKAPTLWR
jgi:hypothetical protein